MLRNRKKQKITWWVLFRIVSKALLFEKTTIRIGIVLFFPQNAYFKRLNSVLTFINAWVVKNNPVYELQVNGSVQRVTISTCYQKKNNGATKWLKHVELTYTKNSNIGKQSNSYKSWKKYNSLKDLEEFTKQLSYLRNDCS